jgi:hypothetical protein
MRMIVLLKRYLRVPFMCISFPTIHSVLDISDQPSYLHVFSTSVSPCQLPAYFPTHKVGGGGRRLFITPPRCANLSPRFQLQNQTTDFHRTLYEHYATAGYLKAVLAVSLQEFPST